MRKSNGDPLGKITFRQVPIGAGGQIIRISQSPDGATTAIAADAYGAYVWGASDTQWRDLYLDTTIPVGLQSADGTMNGTYSDGFGCSDIVCFSATILFMIFDGYVLKSTDTGATFAQTNYARTAHKANSYGNKSNQGHVITIDPTNVNRQLIGSASGIQYTTDGSTYTAVSTGNVTPVNDQDGKPQPMLTACNAAGTSWFYMKYDTGIYRSTTGPNGTFSALASSPVNLTSMYMDPFDTLWVTKYGVTNNVWKWTSGGGWVNLNIDAGKSFYKIHVDQNNSLRIVAVSGGIYMMSIDGGGTWPYTWSDDLNSNPPKQVTREKDIQYLDIGPTKQYHPVANQLLFDKVNAGRLWNAHGSGIVYSDNIAAHGSQITWLGVGKGIEELVSHNFCAIPGGKRLSCNWDMGCYDIQSLTRYINKQKMGIGVGEAWGTAPYLQPIIQQPCSHVDYCADSINWVFFFQHGGWYSGAGSPIGTPHLGYSTDGGETLQIISPQPANKPSVSVGGGSMAVGKMTGSGKPEIITIWNCENYAEYFNGTSWAQLNLPGSVNGDAGFEFNGNVFALAYFLNKQLVCYDKVGMKFFFYNYGTATPGTKGIYKQTSGNNFTNQTGGTLPITNTGGAVHLRWAIGIADYLFLTAGESVNESLFRSTNGAANWNACTTNSGQAITFVTDIGFGKPLTGKSFPAMCYWGSVNGVFGLYVSWDNLVTSTFITKYFNHHFDYPMVIVGDPDIIGRFWLTMHGRGVICADLAYTITATQ